MREASFKRAGVLHFFIFAFLIFICKLRCQDVEEEWRGTQPKMLEVQCEVSSQ